MSQLFDQCPNPKKSSIGSKADSFIQKFHSQSPCLNLGKLVFFFFLRKMYPVWFILFLPSLLRKLLGTYDIVLNFLTFLEHQHQRMPSYSILPSQKATLLFIPYHFTIPPTSKNSIFIKILLFNLSFVISFYPIFFSDQA